MTEGGNHDVFEWAERELARIETLDESEFSDDDATRLDEKKKQLRKVLLFRDDGGGGENHQSGERQEISSESSRCETCGGVFEGGCNNSGGESSSFYECRRCGNKKEFQDDKGRYSPPKCNVCGFPMTLSDEPEGESGSSEFNRPEPDGWRLMWSRTKDEVGNYHFERTLLFPEALEEYRELDSFDERSKNVEPLYGVSTICDTMLGTEDQSLGLIDQVWQEVLNEHGDNSDVAWGIKIMARELKYRFQDGEVFGRRTDEEKEGGGDQ